MPSASKSNIIAIFARVWKSTTESLAMSSLASTSVNWFQKRTENAHLDGSLGLSFSEKSASAFHWNSVSRRFKITSTPVSSACLRRRALARYIALTSSNGVARIMSITSYLSVALSWKHSGKPSLELMRIVGYFSPNARSPSNPSLADSTLLVLTICVPTLTSSRINLVWRRNRKTKIAMKKRMPHNAASWLGRLACTRCNTFWNKLSFEVFVRCPSA
mmetsp:Transcript_43529/g.98045  ORF Transcript_43529/g.98045 Transcript_43529/m.98045 type:complete len:218 (-) Transcript_43529:467-1120(-)